MSDITYPISKIGLKYTKILDKCILAIIKQGSFYDKKKLYYYEKRTEFFKFGAPLQKHKKNI